MFRRPVVNFKPEDLETVEGTLAIFQQAGRRRKFFGNNDTPPQKDIPQPAMSSTDRVTVANENSQPVPSTSAARRLTRKRSSDFPLLSPDSQFNPAISSTPYPTKRNKRESKAPGSSSLMEIEEDADEITEPPVNRKKNATSRESSPMKLTMVQSRSNPDSHPAGHRNIDLRAYNIKDCSVQLEKLKAPGLESSQNSKTQSKIMKQSTIRFPATKKATKNRKKPAIVRFGTPDIVDQPVKRLRQPKVPSLIASDSEATSSPPLKIQAPSTSGMISVKTTSGLIDEEDAIDFFAPKVSMPSGPEETNAIDFPGALVPEETDALDFDGTEVLMPSEPEETDALDFQPPEATMPPRPEETDALDFELPEATEPSRPEETDEIDIALPAAAIYRQTSMREPSIYGQTSKSSQTSHHPEAPVVSEPIRNDKKLPPKKVSRHEVQPVEDPNEESEEIDMIHDPLFKYDPSKNGCKREGLRVRRYCRAWWMSNPPNDVGIVFQSDSQLPLEDTVKKLMKKEKITMREVMPEFIDQFLPSKDKLKRVKAIVKERKHIPKEFAKGKRENPVQKSQKAFKNFVSTVENSEPGSSESIIHNGTFSIDDVNFESISEGISIGAIANNSNMVKMEPGCKVPQLKLKSNQLSIFVMSGTVKLEVDGESSTLAPFCFHNVSMGSSYSYSNSGTTTAVFMINRF